MPARLVAIVLVVVELCPPRLALACCRATSPSSTKKRQRCGSPSRRITVLISDVRKVAACATAHKQPSLKARKARMDPRSTELSNTRSRGLRVPGRAEAARSRLIWPSLVAMASPKSRHVPCRSAVPLYLAAVAMFLSEALPRRGRSSSVNRGANGGLGIAAICSRVLSARSRSSACRTRACSSMASLKRTRLLGLPAAPARPPACLPSRQAASLPPSSPAPTSAL
eukprot:scaffold9860_cov92-Isochrysis_galbana.AAC.2